MGVETSSSQHFDLSDDGPSWSRCVYHTAPASPLTIDEAHRIMQLYRSCLRHECSIKYAAWSTLVEAGRIVPDTGRTQ